MVVEPKRRAAIGIRKVRALEDLQPQFVNLVALDSLPGRVALRPWQRGADRLHGTERTAYTSLSIFRSRAFVTLEQPALQRYASSSAPSLDDESGRPDASGSLNHSPPGIQRLRLSAAFSLSSPMATETSGNFTENVPPNPQHKR